MKLILALSLLFVSAVSTGQAWGVGVETAGLRRGTVPASGSPGDSPSAAGPVERIISIDVPSHDAVYTLARAAKLAVIDAQERSVTDYADDATIVRVRAL